MTSLKRLLMPVAIILAIGISGCNKDDEVNNTVSKNGIILSPANENQTPAVVSSASGTMNVSYNKDTKDLKWDITWTGLSDSLRASHIHGTAPKTGNAGVKVPFTLPVDKSGSYSGTFRVDGVLVKEDSLLAGFYYLNIHSKKYPAGELRGQIEF